MISGYDILQWALHICAAAYFGVVFIVYVIGTIIDIVNHEFDTRNYTRVSVILHFIGALVFSGSFLILMKGYTEATFVMEDKPHSIERIAALNDGNLMHGRIYARRGYIGEDLYYQYMVKLSDGGYKANKVSANRATVYYADDENYRVEWYTKRKEYWYLSEVVTYWKIYIPEGSIAEDFSVDLE